MTAAKERMRGFWARQKAKGLKRIHLRARPEDVTALREASRQTEAPARLRRQARANAAAEIAKAAGPDMGRIAAFLRRGGTIPRGPRRPRRAGLSRRGAEMGEPKRNEAVAAGDGGLERFRVALPGDAAPRQRTEALQEALKRLAAESADAPEPEIKEDRWTTHR